jgi:hypothetical protein
MDKGMAGNSMQKIAFDGTKGYMMHKVKKWIYPQIWLQNLLKKLKFSRIKFWKICRL